MLPRGVDREGLVYLVTNLANGKRYVGQTRTSLAIRWAAHCREAQALKPRGGMPRAIREFGPDKFEIRRLCSCPIDYLNECEAMFIEVFGTLRDGYNRVVVSTAAAQTRHDLRIVRAADGTPVGYEARHPTTGALRHFVRPDASVERNLEEAIVWTTGARDPAMSSSAAAAAPPRETEKALPTNITARPARNATIADAVGYDVRIRLDGAVVSKTFARSDWSMDRKLREAVAWRRGVMAAHDIEDCEAERSEGGKRVLPTNVTPQVRQGTTVRYRVSIQRDGVRRARTFTRADWSLERKLREAIEWKHDTIRALSTNDTIR